VTTPTIVRVACACGHVAQHHCHLNWDTGYALKAGTKWRANATALTCWVLEVTNAWVIYDGSPIASIDAQAMRYMDFLRRYTYLGPPTADDHQPDPAAR
jgi:hypothetical protein